MTFYQLLPVLAVLGFLIFVGMVLTRQRRASPWGLAGLSGAFLAFSIFVISRDGIVEVWLNHTQNAWGNQVWIDLLMAVALGTALLVPRARALGMNIPVWIFLICATASIALYAMAARVIYLERRRSDMPN